MANNIENTTGIKRRNSVKVVSFLKFGKKIKENFYSASITLATDVDGVRKFLNIQVNSKIDLTEFTDKRVQIEGFFTGNMYQGKSSIRLWISSIKEQPTGKGSNSVIFTTRTSFVREGEGDAKWVSAGGSLRFNAGTKDAENMQYANIGIRGNKETLKLMNDQIVTVKGYLGVDYVPANGDRKEFTRPVIVALEVIERQGEGTTPQKETTPTAPQKETTPTAPQKETTPTVLNTTETGPGEINQDEIPF